MRDLKINGKEIRMGVNTTATVSVMSDSAYRRVKGDNERLTKSWIVLKPYTGECVRREGIGLVKVIYKGQFLEHQGIWKRVQYSKWAYSA